MITQSDTLKNQNKFQNVTGGVYKIQIQIHRDKV